MSDQHARSSEPISNHNLRTLFGLSQVPCDTQMRAIPDPIDPSELRGSFRTQHGATAGFHYDRRRTDLIVNSLEYYKVDRKGNMRNWQWVSSPEITPENAEQIMRAGHARWRNLRERQRARLHHSQSL